MTEIIHASWAPKNKRHFSVQRCFQRKSPTSFYSSGEGRLGWFIISSRLVEGRRRRRLTHGTICRLRTAQGSIYRVVRYSPNIGGSSAKTETSGSGYPKTATCEIVLDWLGWIELDGRKDDVSRNLIIEIDTIPTFMKLFYVFKHPEPAIVLGGYLGLISVFLGFSSIFISLASP